MNNKNKKLKIIIFIVVIFTILLTPYIYVELQTAIFGESTQDLYKQTSMIDDSNYQKVFFYSNSKAKVLYADKNNINMCTFHKNNIEEWSLTEWETIRSTQGSADSFIYPYYDFYKTNTIS